jgi:hypothetical protein
VTDSHVEQLSLKNAYTEFHENPTNGLVADTSQTDGRDLHISVLCYFVKNA